MLDGPTLSYILYKRRFSLAVKRRAHYQSIYPDDRKAIYGSDALYRCSSRFRR
jgi:hypothetical protein